MRQHRPAVSAVSLSEPPGEVNRLALGRRVPFVGLFSAASDPFLAA